MWPWKRSRDSTPTREQKDRVLSQLITIDQRISAQPAASEYGVGHVVMEQAVGEMWVEADGTGFTDSQIANVTQRVVEGFPSREWMAGIGAKNGGYDEDSGPWVAEGVAAFEELPDPRRHNMPTPDQIEEVEIRLEAVAGERFAPDGEWMRPSDSPDALPFDALTFAQKVGVLTSEIKWLGFDAAQIADVSRRVIDGEEPYEWMNGLPEGDRQDWARASARKYREERWVAHHDRLPTPEDLAGEDAAIRSLDWAGVEANLPPGPSPVTDAEMEQILAGVERQWPANDNEPDPRFVRADGTVSNRTTSEFVE